MAVLVPSNPSSDADSVSRDDLRVWQAERASQSLCSAPYSALHWISCDYCGGALTLRGKVPCYFLKQMAQAIVADTPGVREIVNRIEVVRGQVR